jgi:hypothetical protein
MGARDPRFREDDGGEWLDPTGVEDIQKLLAKSFWCSFFQKAAAFS